MTPKRPPSQLTFGRRLEVLEEDLEDFWRDVQVGIDEIEFKLKTCPSVPAAEMDSVGRSSSSATGWTCS
jgi:hypothetical protein